MPPLGRMSMSQLRNALAETEEIMEYESEELVDAWIKIDAEHAKDSEMLNRLHFVLSTRMKDRGASQLPHATHDAVYKSRRNIFDHVGFTPILELVPVETCIADGAYFEAWEEKKTIKHDARWDTVKAKTLKKYDPAVTDIIAKATSAVPATLTITPKAPKK